MTHPPPKKSPHVFGFSNDAEVSSHEARPKKNQACFLALIRCLTKLRYLSFTRNKFVCSINVISKSTLTQSAILKLFAFLANFFPTRNLSHCCFCFHLTRSILKSWSKKNILVNSTHFGFYERIRTIFQKCKN